MIELEHSASVVGSKASRYENLGKSKCAPTKRKSESVHKCYYAMRKRICNEPFNTMDLGYVVAPINNNCTRNRDESHAADCIPAETISNNFGMHGLNCDMMHKSIQESGSGASMAEAGVANHALSAAFQSPVEGLTVDQDNVHGQIPCISGEKFSFNRSHSGVDELGQLKEMPVSDSFEVGDLEAKPRVVHDQTNSIQGDACSVFDGDQVFKLAISDCGASFHSLGYCPPLPQTPIWSTIEGVSAPTLPDIHLQEQEQLTENVFRFPDDGAMNNANSSGYDVVRLDFKQVSHIPSDDMTNSTQIPNDFLLELSNALMNFTSEEEQLFMNIDGKDGIDQSYVDGLSSLLLDSPYENIPHFATVAPDAPDTCLPLSAGTSRPGEADDSMLAYGDGQESCSLKSPLRPCASGIDPQFPELQNGVVCCVLNTEDTEVPCNDDVFLLYQMPSPPIPSVVPLELHEASNLSSSFAKGFQDHENDIVGSVNLMKKEKEEESSEKSRRKSQMIGSQLGPEMSVKHPVVDNGIKLEMPDGEHLNEIAAERMTTNAGHAAFLSNQLTGIEQGKYLSCNLDDSYVEKPAHGFDGIVNCSWGNMNSNDQEDVTATIQSSQALHAEYSSMKCTEADEEELPSESDDDIPHFSDIEAMILDMDLSPDDEDLHPSKKATRYQDDGSKRAIIRLEQAALSYMHRAIASRGVLAILYDRHSKFFIKKPEVLLGRATEDFCVDIDLGREGRVNKISRRQAIIRMDEHGSFHLKNLGKCSIFVNNKSIATKQTVNLTSNCLIEIKGMSYVFETNEARLKQYAGNIKKTSQTTGIH